MMNKNINKVYQIVTDKIISELEKGTAPWSKPWNYKQGKPKNYISGKAYTGINTFLLSCNAFNSPYWLTFKQTKLKKGSVKKGQKGTPIIFWKVTEKENKETKEKESYGFLRYYTVFNAEQIEGIDFPENKKQELKPFEVIEKAKDIVDNMQQRPIIKSEDNGRAFYSPRRDVVNMPAKELFKSSELYYSTLFHELSHSTGNTRRLDRDSLTTQVNFGSKTYGKEELTAEMSASFLNGHCGISEQTIEDSSSYIASWLKTLKAPGNKKLVVQAASQAQKSADFILNN